MIWEKLPFPLINCKRILILFVLRIKYIHGFNISFMVKRIEGKKTLTFVLTFNRKIGRCWIMLFYIVRGMHTCSLGENGKVNENKDINHDMAY